MAIGVSYHPRPVCILLPETLATAATGGLPASTEPPISTSAKVGYKNMFLNQHTECSAF